MNSSWAHTGPLPAATPAGLTASRPEAAVSTRPLMVGPCVDCQRLLSWPLPVGGFRVAPVACPQCGQWYFRQSASDPLRAPLGELPEGDRLYRYRRTLAHQQRRNAQRALEVLIGVVAAEGKPLPSTDRHPLDTPAVGVPLDDSGLPVGEARRLTVCDLSADGLGLVAAAPIADPNLLVDCSRPGAPCLQLVCRIRWRTEGGDDRRLGCQLITHHGEFEA